MIDHDETPTGSAAGDAFPVPDELEERVVRTLRRRGLVATPPTIGSRLIFAIAAAVIFAAGIFAGRGMSAPRSAGDEGDAPRFALLLYTDTTATSPIDTPAEEFIIWVRSLRENGRRISGEELADSARDVGRAPGGNAAEMLVGFFVLEAPDLDDAARIAATSPHARKGGLVVVRPIVSHRTPGTVGIGRAGG